MSRRWTLQVTTDDGSTLVRGWQAGTVLMEGGWRPVWLGGQRSWAIDARHEADVLAYIQSRGIGLIVSSTSTIPTSSTETALEDDLLALIDGGAA